MGGDKKGPIFSARDCGTAKTPDRVNSLQAHLDYLANWSSTFRREYFGLMNILVSYVF